MSKPLVVISNSEATSLATLLVMRKSDQELIRVLEDLIEVLCRKGIINLDDLPLDARKKIFERQGLRGQVD